MHCTCWGYNPRMLIANMQMTGSWRDGGRGRGTRRQGQERERGGGDDKRGERSEREAPADGGKREGEGKKGKWYVIPVNKGERRVDVKDNGC